MRKHYGSSILLLTTLSVTTYATAQPAPSQSALSQYWETHFSRGEALERAGRYEPAAREFEIALNAARSENPDEVKVPVTWNNLGAVSRALGRAEDAERYYRLAIAYYEKHAGLEAPLATTLENLAALDVTLGRLSKAEPLYRRSLEIRLRVLPPSDPALGHSLQGMAQLEHERRHFDLAEAYYRQALKIEEAAFGPESPMLAPPLHNLAALLAETRRGKEARPLYERALAIYRHAAPEHPARAIVLRHLAELDAAEGSYDRAEGEFRDALRICERTLPNDHPQTGAILQAYGRFLRSRHRGKEANVVLARASGILIGDARANGSAYVVDVSERLR